MYTTTRFDRLKKLKVAEASSPQARASAGGYLKPLKQFLAELPVVEEVIQVVLPRPIVTFPEPPPISTGYVQSGYVENGYL
jgi:hypothetical protein